MDNLRPSGRHQITLERARELMGGPLADVCRGILRDCCAPIFWFRGDRTDQSILNNGTVTFVRTPELVLGVTAAHVLQGYLDDDAKFDRVTLQLFDAVVDDLQARIIHLSDNLDVATFAVDDALLARLGKRVVPLANWPPQVPQEGRGIMLAGYPAVERLVARKNLDFGLFTALVTARTVTDKQITWLVERDAMLVDARIPMPPPNYGFGGVSGGPLVTVLESEQSIATFALGGIISEHPDYAGNEFAIERVVAVRGDFITSNGRIWR
jgi:hypothetical protein